MDAVQEPADLDLRAGGPLLEVVDRVRETAGDREPEVVGGVDRGLELPAGSREHLGGVGDDVQLVCLHDCLLLR